MEEKVVGILATFVPGVLATAHKVLSRAAESMNSEGLCGYTGGYLACTFTDGTLIVGVMWGSMPVERAAKRQVLAFEKAARLASYNLHLTSYRTRNPKAMVVIGGEEVPQPRYGGAIRAGRYILSFSGFPEKWDEAAMFVLGIKFGWISKEVVFRRISHKRNPHLRPLFEACAGIEDE